MQIIVGSTALEHFALSPRKTRDMDIWVDSTWYLVKEKGLDEHIIPSHILELIPVEGLYATPDAIYTIKCSHASWDIKWDKTIQDIMYLKSKGCRLIPDLYWKLYEHWKTVHGSKDFLTLKKKKEDFFDDYVPHVFDHDYLHELVACSSIEQVRTLTRLKEGSIDVQTCLESGQASPNRPMYTKILKDNEEVMLDHAKFLKMSYEEQVRLFREEIKVIALERYLIPSGFRIGQYKAYLKALKKTITNLTKNWATLFILDNLSDFCIMGDVKWYTNFLDVNKEYLSMSKYVAKENPLITQILAKADSLGIDHTDAAYILVNDEIPDYNEYGDSINDEDKWVEKHQAFIDYLNSEYGFIAVENDAAGDEGVGEYAYAIFQLSGNLYKAEYELRSYSGENFSNFFDGWKEVVKVTKSVTKFE